MLHQIRFHYLSWRLLLISYFFRLQLLTFQAVAASVIPNSIIQDGYSIAKCCPLLDSDDTSESDMDYNTGIFLACINGSRNVYRESKSVHGKYKIALVSNQAPGPSGGQFTIDNIHRFGAYQAGIMASYAETHGYLFRVVTDNNSSLFELDDIRWNKLKILEDALFISRWASDVDYLVWVDSDAIVIDFSLSLSSLAANFPNAHIIASADIRLGLINSGFMILRNSPWVRWFLQEWWLEVDRTTVCDQDAFDSLFIRYVNGDKAAPSFDIESSREERLQKLKILHRSALNSDPPAIRNQRENDPVLHLMGEETEMRAKAFLTGMSNICDWFAGSPTLSSSSSSSSATAAAAHSSNSAPPHQLGLTRERLHSMADLTYRELTSSLMSKMEVSLDSLELLVLFLSSRNRKYISKEILSIVFGDKVSGNIQLLVGSDVKAVADGVYALLTTEEYVDGVLMRFEKLSRAVHHVCDVLNIYAELARIEKDEDTQLDDERVLYRSKMLKLVTRNIELIQRVSALFDAYAKSAVGQRQKQDERQQLGFSFSPPPESLRGNSKEEPEATQTLSPAVASSELSLPSVDRQHQARQISSLLVMLLKRKAEAGNDLFQASNTDSSKRSAAGDVLSTLKLLHSLVAQESRPAVLHMTALMQTSLAQLDFSASIAISANSSDDAEEDNTAADSSKSVSLSDNAKRIYYLQEASAHAAASVNIFETTFNNSVAVDPSTRREHLEALQLLSLSLCSLGDYSTGIKHWEAALAVAASNLRGLELGRPLQDLGNTALNAGICYREAASSLEHLLQGLNEDEADGDRDDKRRQAVQENLKNLLNAAEDVLLKAKDVFSQLIGADVANDSNHAPVDIELAIYRSRLNMVDSILEYVMQKNALSKTVSDHASILSSSDIFNADEWEDCVEGEEGCEAFYIDDEQEQTPHQGITSVQHNIEERLTNVAVNVNNDDEKDYVEKSKEGINDDDDDDDDDDDVLEATAQYREQTLQSRIDIVRQQLSEQTDALQDDKGGCSCDHNDNSNTKSHSNNHTADLLMIIRNLENHVLQLSSDMQLIKAKLLIP